MLRGEFFKRVVRAAVARSRLTIAVAAVLALAGAVLATGLQPSTAIDTLVDRDSPEFVATEAAQEVFGDDAVVILVRGDLQNTLLTPDLGRLRDFEDCIAASPRGLEIPERPALCDELAELSPAKVVYGPGTFIGRAADELAAGFQEQLGAQEQRATTAADKARAEAREAGRTPAEQRAAAAEARSAVEQEFQQQVIGLALKYNLRGPPSISDPQFVSQLVFDTSKGVNVPKARFSYLFPSSQAALIQVRLRPDMTEAERERAIALIGEAAELPRFQSQRGGEYVVTGVPVVINSLAAAIERSLIVLLIGSVLVMAATLALVFRSPHRLLPLVLALGGAAVSFGLVALAGGGLTMASVAALPVMIGLAVDYAIQFQSRFNERRAARDDPRTAASAAARAGAPTIATAGLATSVGFLVLLLSPVPMVRGFGLILVLGVAVALGLALTAGFAALARLGERPPRPDDLPPILPRLRSRLSGAGERLAGSSPGRRAGALGSALGSRVVGVWRAALRVSVQQPRRVLAIGLALAVLGWVADTQLEVVSDVRELVPQDLPALQDINALQSATGVSGQIDVTVRSDRLTDPDVLAWMADLRQRVLGEHGYQEGDTCGQSEGAPELCPGPSLDELLGTAQGGTPEQIDAVLDAVPPYFLQSVLSPERDVANLAFGIRLMPLERQQEVIAEIEAQLDPPAGVEAAVTGLPVLAARGNAELSAPGARLLAVLIGLAAVFAVLLLLRRDRREAALPLIPIAMATGWAALALFILRVPLNPMSAALGAVVIAISTEFSVLLSARYREERAAGASAQRAVELAYGSTGAAVLASGLTATAGFAVLIASDIRMLRDFGVVTVIGLGVSLIGVMVVLPAALVWAEGRGRFSVRDLDPRGPVSGLAERARLARPRRNRA